MTFIKATMAVFIATFAIQAAAETCDISRLNGNWYFMHANPQDGTMQCALEIQDGIMVGGSQCGTIPIEGAFIEYQKSCESVVFAVNPGHRDIVYGRVRMRLAQDGGVGVEKPGLPAAESRTRGEGGCGWRCPEPEPERVMGTWNMERRPD